MPLLKTTTHTHTHTHKRARAHAHTPAHSVLDQLIMS